MTWRNGPLAALALTAVLCGSAFADPAGKPAKDVVSFGALQAPSADEARTQALNWLHSVGKKDEATQKQFDAIWQSDAALLDKVAATFMLGDDNAKQLLTEARNEDAPAPTETPALLKDRKLPGYYRSNLALAYARALAGRRIYEESLEALKVVRVEDVVDPAAFLFNKAVAEHLLMMKKEANESIERLLDVTDAPERYRTVAAL